MSLVVVYLLVGLLSWPLLAIIIAASFDVGDGLEPQDVVAGAFVGLILGAVWPLSWVVGGMAWGLWSLYRRVRPSDA